MSEQVQVDYTLNLLIEQSSYNDLRKIEMTMMRTFSLLQRLFPNSDAAKVIQSIQKMIALLQQAQAAIRAVEAASGPIGWAYAAVSVASTALTTYESTIGCY
jgi:uncharacterized protein YaaW (UPF0174 family)